jgi:anti-sigma factor RsiW
MECEWTERLSLLLDDELDPNEMSSVRDHLKTCPVCNEALSEFLSVREKIRSYSADCDLEVARRSLGLGPRKLGLGPRKDAIRWWRARITLPVPALASLLIAIVVLTVLLVALRPTGSQSSERAQARTPRRNDRTGDGQVLDFSSFDHGGRAVIYRINRAQAPETTR